MPSLPASLTVPWAEQLGASLPPLLVEAERVAATVMPGLHGRRRAGPGEAFWQFRAYVPGDQANRIDWRQSGKSDRLFIRETEWEAAQTVALWVASGPGMEWRSSREVPSKSLRAQLLLLALSSLLLRQSMPGPPATQSATVCAASHSVSRMKRRSDLPDCRQSMRFAWSPGT